MMRITADQVTPALAALFDPRAPASLRCVAVLTGASAGTIYTDDPICPTWGMVRESSDGTLYPGGAVDASLLQSMVEMLRRDGDVLIGLKAGDPLLQLLPPAPDYVGAVLEFFDHPANNVDLDEVMRQLPADHTLCRMDRALFERSLWRDDTLHRWRSADAFLAGSLAVCLMHGQTVLCEASTGPSVQGVREVGVITHEQYRRRGFATLTCTYLIHVCAQAGDRTYYNCNAANEASVDVARKLGYLTERSYSLYAWFKM